MYKTMYHNKQYKNSLLSNLMDCTTNFTNLLISEQVSVILTLLTNPPVLLLTLNKWLKITQVPAAEMSTRGIDHSIVIKQDLV